MAGIVLANERHVLLVSLADDLEAISRAWCAERGLPEKARAKIAAQLQTRLDDVARRRLDHRGLVAIVVGASPRHEAQRQRSCAPCCGCDC